MKLHAKFHASYPEISDGFDNKHREQISYSRLESFRNAGFETVNIVSEDASLYMSMTDLLDLYGSAGQCMFVRNGTSVEMWVMNNLVITVTLVKENQEEGKLAG